jgi:hypothetical protein
MLDNIQLVKFEDGTWGVRKGWVFFKFRDLRYWESQWYNKNSRMYKECRGEEKQAKRAYEVVMDNGEPNEYN